MSLATELQKSHRNYFPEMPAWGAYLRGGIYSRDVFNYDRDHKAVLATVANALITRTATSLGNGHMP